MVTYNRISGLIRSFIDSIFFWMPFEPMIPEQIVSEIKIENLLSDNYMHSIMRPHSNLGQLWKVKSTVNPFQGSRRLRNFQDLFKAAWNINTKETQRQHHLVFTVFTCVKTRTSYIGNMTFMFPFSALHFWEIVLFETITTNSIHLIC